MLKHCLILVRLYPTHGYLWPPSKLHLAGRCTLPVGMALNPAALWRQSLVVRECQAQVFGSKVRTEHFTADLPSEDGYCREYWLPNTLADRLRIVRSKQLRLTCIMIYRVCKVMKLTSCDYILERNSNFDSGQAISRLDRR